MNAKHLFLTLTMLLASFTFAWGGLVTDEISFASFDAKYGATIAAKAAAEEEGYEGDGGYNVFEGYTFSSGSEYAGVSYYDTDDEFLGVKTSAGIASVNNAGYVNTIRVHWYSGTTAGKKVYVYVSNTPFTGEETKATLDGSTTKYHLAATLTRASDPVDEVDITADTWKYVMLIGGATKTYFTQVDIVWKEIVKYEIYVKTLKTTRGSLTVNGVSASAGSVVTSVEADQTVTLVMTPKSDYALMEYSFDDMVFDLSCVGYVEDEPLTAKFTMPARKCTINVVYDEIDREENSVVIKYNGVVPTAAVAVESGLEKKFTFQVEKYEPVYTGVVSVESDDDSKVMVTDYDYNSTTGAGWFTVKGLVADGAETSVQVKAAKTSTVSYANKGVAISVTLREIVLISEYDGRYYAMANSITDGEAAALELTKIDGKYFCSKGTTVSDYTWYAETQIVDEVEKYSLYNAKKSKYLDQDEELLLKTSKALWGKNGGRFVKGGMGAVYSAIENVFVLGAQKDYMKYDVSKCVEEVTIGEDFDIIKLYSTTANPLRDIEDNRTIGAKKLGTICVPFTTPISLTSGATFYTLAGKIVTGSGDDDPLGGIMLDEVADSLRAGHSYIYEGTADAIEIYYGEAKVSEASKAKDGFVGVLPGDGVVKAVPGLGHAIGYYGIKDNLLRYISSGTPSMNAYKAWIYADELDAYTEPVPAPRRRMYWMAGMENVTTGVDELPSAAFINWNEPVYNIMGMRVGKGVTGVLIQNGKKFLVK